MYRMMATTTTSRPRRAGRNQLSSAGPFWLALPRGLAPGARKVVSGDCGDEPATEKGDWPVAIEFGTWASVR
jgi:hypothetical protein